MDRNFQGGHVDCLENLPPRCMLFEDLSGMRMAATGGSKGTLGAHSTLAQGHARAVLGARSAPLGPPHPPAQGRQWRAAALGL